MQFKEKKKKKKKKKSHFNGKRPLYKCEKRFGTLIELDVVA